MCIRDSLSCDPGPLSCDLGLWSCDLRLLSCDLCLLSCDEGLSAHKMPRATPQMSACSSSVQRLAKPTCRWECFWRSLAVCTERPKLMREADRQSGETSCKTDVIITIATSHHRHRSSPSLSPPPSPSEITGPIGREEKGHQRQRHGRRHRRHGL